jgi:FkbM family methyltransferase
MGLGDSLLRKPVELTGRALRRAGTSILRRSGLQGIWIDVGAHHGETTIGYANHNPGLTIYAFEPNLRAAATLIGRAPNLILIPMAVAEADGHAEFHVNAFDAASSLLRIDEDSRRCWTGGDKLETQETIIVPTLRLDTFLDRVRIARVDFLKIDAQGADLAVLRSAGTRLRDIAKITLEVDISPRRIYVGSPSREEVVAFLQEAGFSLAAEESQSYGQEQNLTFERVET